MDMAPQRTPGTPIPAAPSRGLSALSPSHISAHDKALRLAKAAAVRHAVPRPLQRRGATV